MERITKAQRESDLAKLAEIRQLLQTLRANLIRSTDDYWAYHIDLEEIYTAVGLDEPYNAEATSQ